MSLQQYLNNKVLATVSDAAEGGATTVLSIFPLNRKILQLKTYYLFSKYF